MKGSPMRENDEKLIRDANKQREDAITSLMKKGGVNRKTATEQYLKNIKK